MTKTGGSAFNYVNARLRWMTSHGGSWGTNSGKRPLEGSRRGAAYGNAGWLLPGLMRLQTIRSYVLWWPAALAGLFTLATTFIPALHFAYRNPDLHTTLSAVEAVIGLLVAYLAFGRFTQTRSWNDAALTLALVVLGLTNLVFAVVPAVLYEEEGAFSTWAPLTTRLIASAIFAGSALTPARRVQYERGMSLEIIGLSIVILVVVGTPIALLADELPPGVASSLPPDASRPHIEGNPLVFLTQVVQMILYAAAAFGFARNLRERGDEFFMWLAAAATLAAFARLNYVLYPSLYTDFIYTGDVLRLAFYSLLLVGGAREIQSYWRTRAEAAAMAQRNRIARDLHDGVAQELTFVATQTHLLSKDAPGDVAIRRLASAADRAAAEARRAITALSRESDESLSDAVAEIAEETARRAGANVKLDLDHSVSVGAEVKEAVIRIVREAVLNAVRHSDSDRVEVRLTPQNGGLVTIRDRGRGFDAEAVGTPERLGLKIMEAKAQAVDARVEVISNPGEGTTVKVALPLSDR